MNVNKLAGWCLILFGVINVLHEIFERWAERNMPGAPYALVTALFFTFGFVFLCRRPMRPRPASASAKPKGPSILES